MVANLLEYRVLATPSHHFRVGVERGRRHAPFNINMKCKLIRSDKKWESKLSNV